MQNKPSVDLFDSEFFEWTQKPCSPELFSSPIKTQVVRIISAGFSYMFSLLSITYLLKF